MLICFFQSNLCHINLIVGTGNGIVAGCNGTYDIESAVLTIIVGMTWLSFNCTAPSVNIFTACTTI